MEIDRLPVFGLEILGKLTGHDHVSDAFKDSADCRPSFSILIETYAMYDAFQTSLSRINLSKEIKCKYCLTEFDSLDRLDLEHRGC